MDLNLPRTFLEIVETRNFAKAAERLHVTQTAVSARIRSLEELLGRRLFVRNKAGAVLTPAGERFARYARILVQAWEQARHQVAVPPGRRAVLTVGSEMTLWDPLLVDWLRWMHRSAPHLALRTAVATPADLGEQVASGVLDLAVMYAQQQRPGLKIELLIEEKLLLVTTARRAAIPKAADYVFVDWGPEFAAAAPPGVPATRQCRHCRGIRAARARLPPGGRGGLLSGERGAQARRRRKFARGR